MYRRTLIAAAVATLSLGGAAAAAEAPVVSAQQTSTATVAPLTIPGTGVQKGERLPRGARLVFRTVTVEGDQVVRLTLTAPRGKTLRGLVPEEAGVSFVVVSPDRYAGRRQVRVRARAAAAGEQTARIYALVR